MAAWRSFFSSPVFFVFRSHVSRLCPFHSFFRPKLAAASGLSRPWVRVRPSAVDQVQAFAHRPPSFLPVLSVQIWSARACVSRTSPDSEPHLWQMNVSRAGFTTNVSLLPGWKTHGPACSSPWRLNVEGMRRVVQSIKSPFAPHRLGAPPGGLAGPPGINAGDSRRWTRLERQIITSRGRPGPMMVQEHPPIGFPQ